MSRGQTPSQTVGPFFAFGLTPGQYGYGFPDIVGAELAGPGVEGRAITIEGQVMDGAGAPVSDAMIEIWQADAAGRYPKPGERRSNATFAGFGRCGTGTDPEFRFRFSTIKPGSVSRGAAPHISVIVFSRGLLVHAFTRIYFPEDEAAHAVDPVLALVPQERRPTLIAKVAAPALYRFDIHLQGDRETVFFDI